MATYSDANLSGASTFIRKLICWAANIGNMRWVKYPKIFSGVRLFLIEPVLIFCLLVRFVMVSK